MQIHIIGSGALGLLYGGRIAQSGIQVVMWTRSIEQSVLLQEEGIQLMNEQQGESSASVQAVRSYPFEHSMMGINKLQDMNWFILAVKQNVIDSAFVERLKTKLEQVEGRTAIVCVQNGIGHVEKLLTSIVDVPIYVAITTEGAKRLDARTVASTGQGQLWMSDEPVNVTGNDHFHMNNQKKLQNTLQNAGFDVNLSNDINNRVLHKLLINAVINPLTAIFDVTNGQLLQHPATMKIMKALHTELLPILALEGLTHADDSWNMLLQVCTDTGSNVSSMLSDVRAGRMTEIDAINGEISRLAKRQRTQTPYNDAIILLVKSLL